jgi:hypothetical protein
MNSMIKLVPVPTFIASFPRFGTAATFIALGKNGVHLT